jgi:hypothetical protein
MRRVLARDRSPASHAPGRSDGDRRNADKTHHMIRSIDLELVQRAAAVCRRLLCALRCKRCTKW